MARKYWLDLTPSILLACAIILLRPDNRQKTCSAI